MDGEAGRKADKSGCAAVVTKVNLMICFPMLCKITKKISKKSKIFIVLPEK